MCLFSLCVVLRFALRILNALLPAPLDFTTHITHHMTQVRRRGGARIRWRQMSSLDQRGHFGFSFHTLSVCVFLCVTYLFYCIVMSAH